MKRILTPSLIVLVVLVLAICGVARFALRDRAALHASWRQSDLHLWSVTSGPFVVTHLLCKTEVEDTSAYNYVSACLPKPILITDSAGRYIKSDEFQALSWIDYVGHPTEAPALGSRTQAIYYRPERTKSTKRE